MILKGKALREKREEKEARRSKKKRRSATYAAIAVGVIIITLSIFFVYSNEQAKMRGEAFSKAIEFVQEDLRKTYHSFDSKVSMFNQGNITKDDFLKFIHKYQDRSHTFSHHRIINRPCMPAFHPDLLNQTDNGFSGILIISKNKYLSW